MIAGNGGSLCSWYKTRTASFSSQQGGSKKKRFSLGQRQTAGSLEKISFSEFSDLVLSSFDLHYHVCLTIGRRRSSESAADVKFSYGDSIVKQIMIKVEDQKRDAQGVRELEKDISQGIPSDLCRPNEGNLPFPEPPA